MSYFKNIADSASTIFEGLTITASHMLRKPITVQYPDRTPLPVKEMMAPRYRGFLEVDMKICTGCTLCMQACPIGCINIQITKGVLAGLGVWGSDEDLALASSPSKPQTPRPPDPQIRLISKFDIDLSKCMFCGLCTEPCPTEAIHFTREFERATPNIKQLLFKFVEEGKSVVPYKKGSA